MVNQKYKRRLLVTALLVGLCLAWGVSFSMIGHGDRQLRRQSTYETHQVQTANTRIKHNQVTQLYADDVGFVGSPQTRVTQQLIHAFGQMTTYSSGRMYTQHRQALQKLVTDKAFFTHYYQADRDVTGHSIVEALDRRSLTSAVSVYALGQQQYQVLIDYVPYKKGADLDTVMAGAHSYLLLTVTGTLNHFTNVEVTPGAYLQNQTN